MSRRSRYYAYAANWGGVLWMSKDTHRFLQERPHTIPHHQCTHYLGQSQLMTREEWWEGRRVRSPNAIALNASPLGS